MFKVTFTFENGSEVEAFANAGDNLLEVARGANVAIDAPCSGNGACGKCRVQLKSGELELKSATFILLLYAEAISGTSTSTSALILLIHARRQPFSNSSSEI